MSHLRLMFTALLISVPSASLLAQMTVTGKTTTAIHIAAPDGQGVRLDSADYYGSGNDDAFSEYGLTTFNETIPGILSVDAATLMVTVNDRNFSDGEAVEFFFTPDSAADLGGDFANLSYDPALANGINADHFVTAPVSLGVFDYDATQEGGTVVSFDLDIAPVQDHLLAALSTGADFQIIVGATQAEDDITFSGVGNTFDPGDPALALTVSVPEPGSYVLLSLAGLCGLVLRRRR